MCGGKPARRAGGEKGKNGVPRGTNKMELNNKNKTI
jgi:hypothetical protein